jgi:hypothetical protein
MLKILCIILGLLPSFCLAEQHWAVGGWNARNWGAIRLFDFELGKWAIDVDPEGNQQDWGIWQDYDQNSIIILWMDSSRREIIHKHDGKFYHQTAYSFGIASNIEEIQKTIKKKE